MATFRGWVVDDAEFFAEVKHRLSQIDPGENRRYSHVPPKYGPASPKYDPSIEYWCTEVPIRFHSIGGVPVDVTFICTIVFTSIHYLPHGTQCALIGELLNSCYRVDVQVQGLRPNNVLTDEEPEPQPCAWVKIEIPGLNFPRSYRPDTNPHRPDHEASTVTAAESFRVFP